tara:strand:+ start:1111 stop:1629 length:519 start_codon:yes stop_codon:yes gene_type:complete
MKILKTKIKDLLIIKTDIFKDKRGFFKEVIKKKILNKKFVFDCLSHSKKNTLRGLHFQKKKPQGKLITVVNGEILDVVVDLRKNSKTYGKHFSIKIAYNSGFSLYIPEEFAHGFVCLSKTCTIYYKCTNYRHEASETTLKWNDKNLNINWPLKNPILSKKDKAGISFDNIKK